MAFSIPSLKDLTERARQAFRSNLKGSDAWLWPNNVYVSAKVIAGTAYEVLGFADYISRQKFALTADSENLDRHGEEIGLSRRPATPASGYVRLTATGAASVVAGAVFSRTDGVRYAATASAGIASAGTFDVPVEATASTKATNGIAGTALTIVSGVTGSATAVIGPDGITGGGDLEDDESFRARILFRKRNPPHGGSPSDYVIWASAISGVTRVFVERQYAGPGTVRVYPLMDDAFTNGIPSAGAIQTIADYIATQAPAGAAVAVTAPSAEVIDVTIQGLTPNNTPTQEAVLAELRDAFLRLGRVAGADTPVASLPFLATPFTFSRSWLWQAAANASGEERHAITAPAADVTIAAGSIPVLGTVTFTP